MSSAPGARFALAVTSALAALRAPSARADDALSPPPLAVSVSPGTGGGPWSLRVDNTGDVPVRISADARLLALEVTPPAGFVEETAKNKRPAAAKKADDAKPVRCVLPEDARPSTDDGRELVIPAKRSWSSSFDPLLYCFAPRERARLLAGATVKPIFGWASPPARPVPRGKSPAPLGPPFVAAPVGAAVGRVAPAKAIEGAPVLLADAVSTTAAGAAPQPLLRSLVVSLPEALDVSRGNEVSVTVTVANEGDKPVAVLFRPETLRFSVAGPAGSVACGTTRDIGSPIRELYSTIGVKARSSTTVLLTAICPDDTFDEPGIYRVTPILDTSGASARSIGLKTWDGIAEGSSAMLLRVRSARRAETPETRRPRPALD